MKTNDAGSDNFLAITTEQIAEVTGLPPAAVDRCLSRLVAEKMVVRSDNGWDIHPDCPLALVLVARTHNPECN